MGRRLLKKKRVVLNRRIKNETKGEVSYREAINSCLALYPNKHKKEYMLAIDLLKQAIPVCLEEGREEKVAVLERRIEVCEFGYNGCSDLRSVGLGVYNKYGEKILEGDLLEECDMSPGRPVIKRLSVGETTGLHFKDAFVFMFEKNEKRAKGARWSDEQISEWMGNEFPNYPKDRLQRIDLYRDAYNKGGLTKGVVPKILSRRWEEGSAVVGKDQKVRRKIRIKRR